jgi:hypothetical protein
VRALVSGATVAILTGAFFTGGFGLQTTLPRPPREARVVARVAKTLARIDAVITTADDSRSSARATCSVLPRRRELVNWQGTRFVLAGMRPETLDGRRLPRQRLRVAYLAGCPRLIARTLGVRLRSGVDDQVTRARLHGRAVDVLVLSTSPALRLLVSKQDRQPLAVEERRGSRRRVRPLHLHAASATRP